MEPIKITVFSSWLSYLINGDMSGYEDDEIQLIEQFVTDTVMEYGNAHFIHNKEIGFTNDHDLTYLCPLAGDCSQVLIIPNEV